MGPGRIEDVFYDCEVPSLSFTLELLPHNLHDLLKQKYQLPLKKVKVKIVRISNLPANYCKHYSFCIERASSTET
jgi:hypothetical protein